MAKLPEALPPKTHNNPPSDLEYLKDNLELRYIHILQEADKYIKIAEHIPAVFTEENEAEYVTDFIKKVDDVAKRLEKSRKEEKDPFLRQGQFVDDFFNTLRFNLGISEKKNTNSVIERAKRPLSDWLQRKANEERLRREAEADLLRKESNEAVKEVAAAVAEEAPAAAISDAMDHAVTMNQVSRIAEERAVAPIASVSTGALGSAALKTKWIGTIKDIENLDLAKLRPYISLNELQKAVDKYVKAGGRNCDGAEIQETLDVGIK